MHQDYNMMDEEGYWGMHEDYNVMDYHCQKKTRGMAATWWPWQFTGVEDIFNPFLHSKQQQEGQSGDKEDLRGL
jgi:hypothetical protein